MRLLLTEQAKKIYATAEAEAARLGADAVTPEHLLLALVREKNTAASRVLAQMRVSPDELERELISRLTPQEGGAKPLSPSPRLQKALDLADDETRQLFQGYIGAEHLLLGLVREADGLTGKLFTRYGVSLGRARDAVEDSIYPDQPRIERQETVAQKSHAPRDRVQDAIDVLTGDRSQRLVGIPPVFLALTSCLFGFLGCLMLLLLLERREMGMAVWGSLMLFGMSYVTYQGIVPAPERAAAHTLGRCDDKRAVCALTYIARWNDRRLRNEAIAALTRILPQLQASDAPLFDPAAKQYLLMALNQTNARRKPDFILAILKALEQVGDETAILPVQRLTRLPERSANDRAIREAAENCLGFLEAQRSRRHASRTLLRPATSETVSADQLLRPAAAVADPDPQTLLRSLSSEGEVSA